MRLLTKIWLLAFFLLSSSASAQQDRNPTHAIYLEVGGPGIVASGNVERTFFDGRAAARVGIGVKGVWSTWMVCPLGLRALIGRGQHKLEVGAGVVVPGHSIRSTYPTAVLGLRIEPAESGLFLRQAFTPYWDGDRLRKSIGFSIGYAL